MDFQFDLNVVLRFLILKISNHKKWIKWLYTCHYKTFILMVELQSPSVLHRQPKEIESIYLYAHNMIYCLLTGDIKCNLRLMLYRFNIYHVKDIKLVSCF